MDSTSTTVTLVITCAIAIVVGSLIVGFHLRKCYRERHQRRIHDPENGLHRRILEAELEAERGRSTQQQQQQEPPAPTTTTVTITEPPPAYTPGEHQRENENEHEPGPGGAAAVAAESSSSVRRSSTYRLAIRSSTMTRFEVDFDAETLAAAEREEEVVTVSNAHLPPPYSRHDPRGGRLPSYGSVDAATATETSVSQGRPSRGERQRQQPRRIRGGPSGSLVAGDRSAFYSQRRSDLRATLDDIERGYPCVRGAFAGIDDGRWSWSRSSSSSSSSS